MLDEGVLKRARNRALRYLSYRDRSESEMRTYLMDKDFPPPIVDQTIAYLKNLRYIDDPRFARQWGRMRIEGKQFGKFRLQQELRQKGLNAELIENTLQELYGDVDEVDLARTSVEKKMNGWKHLDKIKQKRRLAQFLQGIRPEAGKQQQTARSQYPL